MTKQEPLVEIPITGLVLLSLLAIIGLPGYFFGTGSYTTYIEDAPPGVLEDINQGDKDNRLWIDPASFVPIPHNLPPWQVDKLPGYDYKLYFRMRHPADECAEIPKFLDQFGINYYIPHCEE